LRVRYDARGDDCGGGFVSSHSSTKGYSRVEASFLDSRGDGADQADAGRSRSDGSAPRRVDEVLGREHQESRTATVTAAPPAGGRARNDSGGNDGGRGALALHGITRRFGEFTAVDNLSVEVGP